MIKLCGSGGILTVYTHVIFIPLFFVFVAFFCCPRFLLVLCISLSFALFYYQIYQPLFYMTVFKTPLLKTLRAKTSAPKHRKRTGNLSKHDRRLAAAKARATQKNLYTDLQELWETLDSNIRDLAVTYKKTVSWMRSVALQYTHTAKGARAVTGHNAWKHCRSMVISDGESTTTRWHVLLA